MADIYQNTIRILLVFSVVIIIPTVFIVSCKELNRSGFCISRMGWVSDDEKIAFAITAELKGQPTMRERLELARSFMLQHPDCCRIYLPAELVGTVTEIETGLISRPTYVEIKGGNPKNVIVSNCADAWWPWNDVPLPPEADIP